MLYHSQKLENERWGIFADDRLIATIGCDDTAQKIVHFLENRLSQTAKPLAIESYASGQYFNSLKLRA